MNKDQQKTQLVIDCSRVFWSAWPPNTKANKRWAALGLKKMFAMLEKEYPVINASIIQEEADVLKAAKDYSLSGDGKYAEALEAACLSYSQSLAPPDPVREAREALAKVRPWTNSGGSFSKCLDRLSDALDRLAEKGGAA